jgi:hypothetical protein
MLPHVRSLDIFNNGIDYEVIVMKTNKANGDVFFIRTDYLDDIDRNRAKMILQRRDAGRYEAWDLFSQITLANGVNALEYFHQFVKVKTRSGEIMTPSLYRAGSRTQAPKLQIDSPSLQVAQQPVAQQTAAPKRAGRPPKAAKAQ